MRRQVGLFLSVSGFASLVLALACASAWADDSRTQSSAPKRSQPSEIIKEIVLGDTLRLRGNAGGSVRATQYGVSATGPCMGWIPSKPQHRIELKEAAKTRISVHSTADTTLILIGEKDGKPFVRCSDDVDGNDPELNEVLAAGRYQLFVGTWNAGSRVPFSMRIDATASSSSTR